MKHVTSVDLGSTADNEFSLARAASPSYLEEGLHALEKKTPTAKCSGHPTTTKFTIEGGISAHLQHDNAEIRPCFNKASCLGIDRYIERFFSVAKRVLLSY
jgi:hypothetical protein